jgi:hypothetical protein
MESRVKVWACPALVFSPVTNALSSVTIGAAIIVSYEIDEIDEEQV